MRDRLPRAPLTARWRKRRNAIASLILQLRGICQHAPRADYWIDAEGEGWQIELGDGDDDPAALVGAIAEELQNKGMAKG